MRLGRDRANQYTYGELEDSISRIETMIESIESIGFNSKSEQWSKCVELHVEYARKRYNNSLVELRNFKKMLRFKNDMQNIYEKYPNISEEKAYFIWSFTKDTNDTMLEQCLN